MKAWRREWHELTGGYAVDALDPPETVAFEQHLTRCGSCAIEVLGLRETAARLGLAAAATPPARMQDRVLAATYQTRQLPPLTSPEPRWTARRLPVPRRAFAIAGATLAAVLIVGLAVTQSVTSHRLDTARARDQAVAAVLTAPDARTGTARTASGGTVTVIASAALHEAIITARAMPALAATQVYQAWIMGPGGARSAGLLQPGAGAPGRTSGTSLLLAGGTITSDRIGITIEPAGGTTHPTTAPLVTVPLPT